MRVLALDVASKAGWARSEGGEVVASGVVKLRQRTVNKVRQPRGAKFSQFRGWLDTQEGPGVAPDVLVIERASGVFKSAAAGSVIFGLLGIAEAWAFDHGIPVVYITAQAVKKHATGSGRADKAAMLEAARKRWPSVEFADDNEADARHLADCYAAQCAADAATLGQ